MPLDEGNRVRDRQIYRLVGAHLKRAEVGAQYGISAKRVGQIIAKERWRAEHRHEWIARRREYQIERFLPAFASRVNELARIFAACPEFFGGPQPIGKAKCEACNGLGWVPVWAYADDACQT